MDNYFTYRGDIRAAVGVDTAVCFVTVHPEGLPTAVYRYTPEDTSLTEQPLPCGGVAIAADAAGLYVAGTDRRVYSLVGKKAPVALTEPFADAVAAVTPVSQDRLAVVSGKFLHLVSRNDGKTVQSLELSEVGTCIGTDKTGNWLAVGGEKGAIAVFDGQDKPEFEPAEADKVHDGAVTTILFEPEELRFFSTGADHKLLSTHARGRLEPEDKGRGNTHEDAVTALVYLPTGDRLISGSRDKTVKNWPRAGAVKPTTLSDKVGKVVALAVVTEYDDPRIAVLCDDNTIRILPINTDDGRFEDDLDDIETAHGALAWANEEFTATWDTKRREKAVKQLTDWNDAASLELIAKRVSEDTDQAVRVYAAKQLGLSGNPRAVTLLEPFIAANDDKVRIEAFKGLQTRLGVNDYRPIDAALATGQPEVGVLAVKALEPLAKADDQALARLTQALEAKHWDVRKQALASLEAVFDTASPQASLTALTTSHGDLRALALWRFHERKLLDRPEVLSAVRRKLEDDDAAVRLAAFLLSVSARTNLATVLRGNDADLHRQLNELERSDKKQPEPTAKAKDMLDDADYATLLQATASRALDTCLRGAKGLAVLGDPRAFPLLLQLSREDQEYARVEVCRALAALGDERAVNRLRSLLLDPQPSVRDAAYTAVAKLYETTPLAAAEAGLSAANDDVRQRGLQTLLAATKKVKPKSDADPAWGLFVRALNDSAAVVRREAFKSAVNQTVGGGGEGTLRFTLQSIHADVRREALTEVQAQIGEAWATPLLHEFFQDADPGLRKEAFEFAVKKNKELPPLEAALKSRYPDARLLAIDGLLKKHTKAAQAVTLSAIADPDAAVRKAAVEALVEDDAKDALTKALTAEQPDVRARAAAALARFGDPAALPVLRELAFAPEPDDKLKVPAWKALIEVALTGLTDLGDPSVFPDLLKRLDSPHDTLRHAAAVALSSCTPPSGIAEVRSALGHADPAVRVYAAHALALKWDVTVHPLLFTPEAEKLIGVDGQLTAVAVLGVPGAARLAPFLDSADDAVRQRALLLHLLLERAGADGTPDLLLQALSAKAPRVRLTAAKGLEPFHDPTAFREFVVKAANDRGDETAWKVTPEAVDELAAVLAFADPLLRARANRVMAAFGVKEQARWNQEWGVFAKRFAPQVEAARKQLKPTKSKLTQAELRELAFGAYVGLVREQGSGGTTPAVVRVRQTALSRLFAIAGADKTYARSARPVLTQALSDPNQPVRVQAFDHLHALGVRKTTLGAEALEAGYTDLGVKGLELLTGGTGSKDGEAVLERVMLSRADDLATEAAKLLVKTWKTVPVAAVALDAVYEPLRVQAVNWLAAEYDDSADAKKSLRGAVNSRYRKVREEAAFALATKKDPAAFDTLAALLKEATDEDRQEQIAHAFDDLGDKRAVSVLLDRIEHDPTGTATTDSLFGMAAYFRDIATADRWLRMADNPRWRENAIGGAVVVAGFEQQFPDPDDEIAFAEAEKKLQPRHPALHARVIEKVIALGEVADRTSVIGSAKHSRGNDVDPHLATLVTHSDEDVRNLVVEVIGWRVRKRGGPLEPLLKAIKHKDPTTQFLAAEGLAKAGRIEGLQVLLSGIEYLDDVALRQRAVLALGELSDPRAVDVVLKLATENGHALQEAAAEAIGHLRRSPRAEEIGKTLERLAKSPLSGVMQRALVGLRWFDSPSGWQTIRGKTKDSVWKTRQIACEQLGFDTDPHTKDLLLDVLRKDTDNDATGAALDSAVRLFGPDSLEPFYAAVVNERFADYDLGKSKLNPIKKACEHGDPLRLLDLFPKCSPDIQARLEASLTSRKDLPVKEATAVLNHADDATVRLAARLLAKATKPTAEAKNAVTEAVQTWWQTWQDRRAKYGRGQGTLDAVELAGQCLQSLFWTAKQLGAAGDELNGIVVARANDPLAKSVRLDALRMIAATEKPGTKTLQSLEALATDADADVRTLAASLLAKFDQKRAAGLVPGYLTDKPTFTRVVSAGVKAGDVLKAAVAQPHQQSVALQPLIAAKDVVTLAAVAKDKKASEPARLGAVEGLGFMADEAAETVLAEIGTAQGDDEDVRKAAWRALRRSKRRRQKQAAQANGAT